MLVQNNNRANLPRGHSISYPQQQQQAGIKAQRDISSTKQGVGGGGAGGVPPNHQPLRTKQVSQIQQQQANNLNKIAGGAGPASTSSNAMTGAINMVNLLKKTGKKSSAAASKENNQIDGRTSIKLPTQFVNENSYKDTSASNNLKNVGNITVTKISSGRQSRQASSTPKQNRLIGQRPPVTTVTITPAGPHRQLTRSWAQACPCNETRTTRTSLIEESGGHFNCINCGAMAFRQSNQEGRTGETRPVFALKLEEDRLKIQTPPEKILRQLRETSESQRAELLTFVPKNEQFDTRILQIRETMLELICEVGDCLKQSQLTIHLAIEYMDRYLLLRNHFASVNSSMNDNDFVTRIFEGNSADAVALTCLLLASKFDEIDDNIPLIEELCKGHSLVRDSLENGFLLPQSVKPRLSQNRSQPGLHAITRCELYLLNILCWDLNTVTPLHFVLNHLYQGVVFSNDYPLKQSGSEQQHKPSALDRKLLQKIRRHIDYFALQAIKQEFMLTKKYSDQTIAAAIIYASRQASKAIESAWNFEAFNLMFGSLLKNSLEVQECFDILYAAYDQSHHKHRRTKSLEDIAAKKRPLKIEINFAQVDNKSSPQRGSIGTERNNNSSEESEVVELEVNNAYTDEVIDQEKKKKETSSQSGDQAGLSTRGCEVSNSSSEVILNSNPTHIINKNTSSNNEDYSHAADTSNENSSSGIDESIDNQRKITSKSQQRKKSATKSSQSGRYSSQFNKKSQSTQKTNKKSQKSQQKATTISTFEQQTTLNPCFAELGKSLSPIKEYKNRDDGPIQIFKQKEQLQLVPQQSRERSDSSTSLLRLQPTMMKSGETVHKLTASGSIKARIVVSDESFVKRGSLRGFSRESGSVTPTCGNFSQQNRFQFQSRGQLGRKTAETQYSQERANQKIQKISQIINSNNLFQQQIQNQRNSDPQEEKQEQRIAFSKSGFSSRKTDLIMKNSQIPAVAVEIVDSVDLTKDDDDHVSQYPLPEAQRSVSTLEKIKTQINADFRDSQKSRDQNFIKRNINYVTQLAEKTKDKKSLVASRSFIDQDIKSKIVSNGGIAQIDDSSNNCNKTVVLDLSKLSEQPPSKIQRFAAARSQKKSIIQRSVATVKSQYFSTSQSESGQQEASESPVFIKIGQVLNEKSFSQVCSNSITPKQVASYKPSKLFSKKSSLNATQQLISSVAEQPRASNPKTTALYKFKIPQQQQRNQSQLRTASGGHQRQLSRSVYEGESSNKYQQASASAYSKADNSRSFVETNNNSRLLTNEAVRGGRDPSPTIASFAAAVKQHQRSQINHLRPTKSSMLRSKSNLGCHTSQLQTLTAVGNDQSGSGANCGGITGGKVSVLNRVQVNVPSDNQFHKQKFSQLSSSNKQNCAAQSPQFGGLRANRKQLPQHLKHQQNAPIKMAAGLTKIEVDLTTPTHVTIDKELKISQQPLQLLSQRGRSILTAGSQQQNQFDNKRKTLTHPIQRPTLGSSGKFAQRRSVCGFSTSNKVQQEYGSTNVAAASSMTAKSSLQKPTDNQKVQQQNNKSQFQSANQATSSNGGAAFRGTTSIR